MSDPNEGQSSNSTEGLPDVLTIDDVRRLRRVAQREEIREKHARKFDAVVNKTNMTEEDARLSGALKSVQSASRAYENALAALEKAREEVQRTSGELDMVREIYDKVKSEIMDE